MHLSWKQILLNILKCCIVFYASYYIFSSLLFAIFRLENFSGRIPFDSDAWPDISKCCTKYSDREQVNVISLLLTYSVSGPVVGIFIIEWMWDYAVTITIVHICLTSLVNLNFPLVWSWWVTLGGCLVVMISLGEAVAFLRRRFNRAKVEPQAKALPNSYLYRKT